MKKVYLLFLLLIAVTVNVSAKLYDDAVIKPTPKSAAGNLKFANSKNTPNNLTGKQSLNSGKSLSFVENKGQITDQNSMPRHDIQYSLSAASGLNIFIGNGAIHYQFSKCDNPELLERNQDPKSKFNNLATDGQLPTSEKITYSMYRMDVELVGANKNAHILTEQKTGYYENYFTPNTGENGATAHAYNRIMYKNVYPNIDWVLYTTTGKLKHEFVVHKGGHVSDIKLKYGGATSLKLDNAGSLTASTPQGNITEQAPYTYQKDGKKITSSFKLNGDVLSYETGEYSGELVIDPSLAWATYYGGDESSGNDISNDVVVDNAGNIYIVGYTHSTSSIATVGAHDATYGGSSNHDAYLVKFNNTGIRQWATYYGGSGSEQATSVAVDGSGNIYMGGHTESSTNIATSGAHDETFSAGNDVFLVKFNGAGVRQWATYYGGSGNEIGPSVATDGSGNVYIAGQTNSTSDIATAGAHDITRGGLYDAYLVKFNSSGTRQWATYYGGEGVDRGYSIAVDGAGNVIMTGVTESTADLATIGAHDVTRGGTSDAFVVKFNGAGVRQWASYYGGSLSDWGTKLAVDGSGNIFLTGFTQSSTEIATTASHDETLGGSQDAFLVKFNSSGVRQWATYYGGSNTETGWSLKTDGDGSVWVCGSTQSSADIATTGSHDETLGGSQDAFLVKFNTAGIRQWSSYYGGSGSEVGNSVTTDLDGNVWMVGHTSSTTNIATSGAHDETLGGSQDAFLAKFAADPAPASITGASSVCVGATTTLANATTGGTWSSASPSVATVGSTGIVTGVAAGTAVISYTVAGSSATTVVTVTPFPNAGTITGASAVCAGATIAQSNATSGGVWTSSATGIATVGSTGTTTGIAAGTAIISYTVTNSCGSVSATKTITVNPLPNAGTITGASSVCAGSNITLGNATTGGVWTSSATGIATVGSTGTTTGIAAGTAIISYTVTNSCGSVSATKTITVNPFPNAGTITGLSSVNAGSTITLSNLTTGGTWSSSNTSIATVGSTGVVTGVAVGTVTISYFVGNSCGVTAATHTLTVSCSAWNSVGNVGFSAGAVEYTSLVIDYGGTPYVAYRDQTNGSKVSVKKYNGSAWVSVGATGFSNGAASYVSIAVDGVGTPYVVYQDFALGRKAVVKKYNGSAWVSVGVDGISTGEAQWTSIAINSSGVPYIIYKDDVNSDFATVKKYNGSTWVSVGTDGFSSSVVNHTVIAIDASGVPYVAYQDNLTDNKAVVKKFNGSTWINVGGVASAGLVYWVTLALDGTGTPYVGYYDGSYGGKATVKKYDGSAWVTLGTPGFSTGAAGVTSLAIDNSNTPYLAYRDGTFSLGKATVKKYNGSSWVTVGSELFSPGYVNYTSIAINNSGVPFVAYSDNASGNKVTVVQFGSCLIGSISGTLTVCESDTTMLANTTIGGTWSSASPTIASIGSTGIVTGVAAGTAVISYTTTGGTVTATVTVNPLPNAGTVTGASSVCAGSNITLGNATSGGVWSSSATSIATVGSTGTTTGIAAGTAIISYTVTNSCGSVSATKTITVNPLPNAGTITGLSSVNAGSTITLSNTTTGGTWSSSNASVATVGTGGIVTGVAAGTVTISYTVTNSCGSGATTKVVSVNALGTVYCGSWGNVGSAGFSAGMANYTSLVLNSSGLPYLAYMDYALGDKATVKKFDGSNWVTIGTEGFSAGATEYTSLAIDGSNTAYVAYKDAANGNKATVMKFNGSSWVAVGSPGFSAGAAHYTSIALDGSGTPYLAYKDVANGNKISVVKYTGGSWVNVGTVGFTSGPGNYPSLVINSSGVPYVAYKDAANGNKATVMKFDGSNWVMVGSAGFSAGMADYISLAMDGTGTPYVAYQDWNTSGKATVMKYNGISWVTVGAAEFSIGAAGFTSLAIDGSGTPHVAYVDYGSSMKATVMKFNGSIWTVVGTAGFSAGSAANYTSIKIDGGGTAFVGYQDGGTSGKATVMKFATSALAPITGTSTVCVSATTTLTNTTTGGTWSTSTPTVATIGTSGIVTGVGAGTATISYVVSGGCITTKVVTVNGLPNAGTITGASSVNAGSTITLSNTTTGGTWSSSNIAIATVGSTGVVTGVAAGSVAISYTVTNGCGSTVTTLVITVNATGTVYCGSWGNVGSAGFSAGTAFYNSLAMDGIGVFYNAYSDFSNGQKATVMKFSGGSWVNVGGAGLSVGRADWVSLAIDGSGTPYVAYMDFGNGNKATVMKFDGSSWMALGSAGFSAGGADYTTLAIDGTGTPYVAYRDNSNSYKATVKKYTGSSWVTVGSLAFSAGTAQFQSLVIDGSGIPYLAYSDWGNGKKATVMKFNGSSWVAVGSVGFSAGEVSYTSLSIDGSGTLYIAYKDVANGNKATVMKFNGSSWINVGAAAFSAGEVQGTSLKVDGEGTPYVAYTDYDNGHKATVKKFNGSNWVSAGNTGFSADQAWFTSLAIDASNTPCLAFSDNANSQKATVMKLATSALAPITGTSTVCVSATTALTNTTTGGSWSSSTPSVATVGTSGIVTGVGAGTTTISYMVSGGCITTKVVTVNGLPNAGTITGASSVNAGSTITLSNTTTGGVWSSSSTSVATVGSTGVVTGVAAGTVTVSYTVSNACGISSATSIITVSSSCPLVINSILGNGVAGNTGDGGLSNVALTNNPQKVATDAAGNIYIAEKGNHRIRKINTSGIITTIAGTGSSGFSGDGGPATAAQLYSPNSVVVDSSGNIYVSDDDNNRIRKISTTGIITTVVGNGTYASSGDGGPSTAAAIKNVFDIAVNNSGTIYLLQHNEPKIRKVVSGIITTIAGTGVVGFSGDAGPATAAQFSSPNSIALDKTGNLYVADANNYRVRRIGLDGIITTYAGTGVSGISGNGGSATAATFAYPYGVAVDTFGNVFVASSGDGRIRRINPAGIVTAFAGAGITSASGDGGAATSAGMTPFARITVDNSGSVYVTDQNHRVRKISYGVVVANITGTASVCLGSTTTLSNATSGGVWSSSATSTATVGSTGIVTGVSAGTATISYTVTNSCGSASTITIVTVNPLPNAGTITGATSVCVAGSITLSNTTTGGTWSSSNTSVATVGSTGLVNGVASGTTTISYSVTNGCGTVSATKVITVNTTPFVGTITGASIVCAGSTITLSNAASGGTWSSSASGIASVNSSGIVTGVVAGTATISYTVTNTCGTASATRIITVNPLPNAGTITGASSVNAGATITLSNTTTGGAWSSSNTSVATIGSTGIVTGIAGGTTTISYTVSNSCGSVSATRVVTVTAVLETPITGTLTVCAGSTTTLSNATSGGAWSSSNTMRATVNAEGVVSGVSAGTAIISYSIPGSTVTAIVTINALPATGTFTGSSAACVGNTLTLSNSVPGGTWSSSTDGATVGSTGVVTGVAAGYATISYTVSNECGTSVATKDVLIYSMPDAGTISGTSSLCVGTTATLSNTTTGGTWSSGYAAAATVDAAGLVTGVGAGNATISYRMTNFCGTAYATQVVTVNPLPNAGTIGGPSAVCEGNTITMPFISAAGSWSSSNPSAATIDNSTRIVTGVAAGTTTISFTVTNSCGTATSTKVITVNPDPVAGSLSGASVLCAGATTTITPSVSGGTWVSSNPTFATVTTSGVVTGVAAGSITISYFITNGCGVASATHALTINPAVGIGTIGGGSSVCAGSTIALTNTTTGGTWSSTNTGAATIGTTGVLTGVAEGTTTISYVVSNSCGTATATKDVTVNPLPIAGTISGPSAMCTGTTISLSTTGTGGSWISGAPSFATISSAGVVTATAVGSVMMTYRVINGCGTANATHTVTITTTPTVGTISGPSSVCASSNITLAIPTTGGTWSSSATSIATIGSTGIVSSVAAGTSTISYTVTGGCGSIAATRVVTVLPLPAAGTVSGTNSLCVGATSVFSSTESGGTWSSNYPAGASVNSSTGLVTGVAVGSFIISYRMTNSCGTVYATRTVTVSPVPNAGTIGGANQVCVGATTSMPFISASGVWSSSNPSVATINASRVVTGIALGTVTISHTVTTGCGTAVATKVMTVNPLPVAGTLSGSSVICVGNTATITPSVSGGTWSSNNPTKASVNIAGVVTGVATGNAVISYLVSNSCGTASATRAVTVNPAVTVAAIGGLSSLCAGSTITLTNTTTGGTWSSTNTGVATIGSTGILTGVAAGTTTVSYVVSNSCGSSIATRTITVNPLPTAGTVSGATVMCISTTTTLSTTGTGGTWISGSVGVATINSSGIVTALAEGAVPITYRVINGCGTANAIHFVTISALPAIGATISGSPLACVGGTSDYSNPTGGGVGTWSSSTPAVATIVSGTGVLTGVSVGIVTISYVKTNGCGSSTATKLVTVMPLPVAGTISGTSPICRTTTAMFSSTEPGGTWSSNYPAGATVSTSGLVTGVANGNYIISYRMTNSCGTVYASFPITVISTPDLSVISGVASVCVGSTTTLGNTIAGGTWTSSNTGVATIAVPAVGSVTGVATGTSTISYTASNTCGTSIVSRVVTVNSCARPGVTVATDGDNSVFTVSPNPTTGAINLTTSVSGKVVIYTIDGKELEQYEAKAGTTGIALPAGLANGVYMLRFNGADGSSRMVRLVYQQ